jgi:hypothetical protein
LFKNNEKELGYLAGGGVTVELSCDHLIFFSIVLIVEYKRNWFYSLEQIKANNTGIMV